MEVPVTKIKYVDRVVTTEDVPLCIIPYAKDTSVEEILNLSQKSHTALLKCNASIEMYNKTK